MIRQYYRAFAWFLKAYKWHYVLGIVCMLASYYLNLLPPRLTGQIADELLAGTLDTIAFQKQLIYLIGLVLLNYGLSYVWGVEIFRGTDEMERLSHRRIFARLLCLGPSFYMKNPTGSLMGKATNDVSSLGEFAGFGIMAIFDASIWPLSILGFMLTISWRLTLLALLPFPILIWSSKKVGRKLYDLYDRSQEAFDDMNQAVLEGVSGVRVLRAYSREAEEEGRFAEQAEELYKRNMATVRYQMFYGPMCRAIPALAFAAVLLLGVSEIRAGRLTAGSLLSFSVYVQALTWPMISIGEFINVGQTGYASMQRVQEILDSRDEVVPCPEPQAMPAELGLEMRNFSFTYPSGETVLHDINFKLEAGQTLGLVGPVGSGKSSLIRQFLHYYAVPEGKILIGGRDINELDRRELREHVAYVPQQNFLFSQSVRDNVLFGLADEFLATEAAEQIEARLWAALEAADFIKDLPQLPQGLDSQVGEKGLALSGGQKQRLAIARALLKEADILLLDDCLSAVDALTEENIIRALRSKRVGKTTVIAAHRLSALRHADQILVLQEGFVTERGTHDDLLRLGGWYAEQVERQSKA